jgi:hypothetical protein
MAQGGDLERAAFDAIDCAMHQVIPQGHCTVNYKKLAINDNCIIATNA